MTRNHDPREPRVIIDGKRCRDCGRAMLFSTPDHKMTRTSLERVLYLIGAVELTPGRWGCFQCSRKYPSVRLKADGEQSIQGQIVTENFSHDELQVIGWGAR